MRGDEIIKESIESNGNISGLAKDLLSKLTKVDPNYRCSAKEALDHPWFNLDVSSVNLKFDVS